ncbi:acyl-CoA thioesterase [Clostridium massiliamazoniense]|uniref:acyl-CoA thioesterase n=1 Tax=Clostridium massiliamazoniense TaxID=1347366 RepID=UPI0006D84669|nr:acyl-CoA thioesterase [Clostridium massiliamazoniense]
MQKRSIDSKIVVSEVVWPHKANIAGNMHGGEVMKIMDSTAYASSRRYANTNTVTARVDELEFHLPIFIGDLLTCTAQVVYVGKSSMQVKVVVEVESLECVGACRRNRALTAYFTMVALDENGKPTLVPELIIETDEEKLAYEEGKERYERQKFKK